MKGIGFLLALCFIMEANSTFFARIIQVARNNLENDVIQYPKIADGVGHQPRISRNTPFPCDVKYGRSRTPPTNVHRLRPGDLDVIGGLGDSLMAASGALEEFAVGAFIEARGVSWAVGGQENWRTYFTLPNIIKEFNPNLTGFSLGTSEFVSPKARLNLAYPVSASEDALYQAKLLVNKIRKDPKIDFHNHWKLITIMFGANDICSAQCYKPAKFSPEKHAFHLRRTLDFLRRNLPRTMVNLVPTIDVTVSVRVGLKSMMCNFLHPLYCACMHFRNASFPQQSPQVRASVMSHLYQQAVEKLVQSGRYDKSQDFTVVMQPFTKNFNSPNADPMNAPKIDSSLVTYDCFHFSQRGHALAANMLWNDMMSAKKVTRGLPKIFETMMCPTKKNPYIFTNLNAKYYLQYGVQDPFTRQTYTEKPIWFH